MQSNRSLSIEGFTIDLNNNRRKEKKLRGKGLTQCYQSCSNRGLNLEDPPATSLDISRSTFKKGLDLENPPANCKKKEVSQKN